MSATISANDLKFTIFGSGHDYTLIDSGEGEKRFFSHPFMPKGSVLRAGNYLFYVPDAQGNRIDAVKDDMSHCTFTPALNTALNTEGEQNIKVKYHREYIHDEETIIVEKTLECTIEVVDHGNVVYQDSTHWIYSDGYCFIKPMTTWIAEASAYTNENQRSFSKCSSIPWRAYSLKNLLNNSGCSDISELEYADVTDVQTMEGAFRSCAITDYEPIKDWNVSTCRNFKWFNAYSPATDLSPLGDWLLRGITVYSPNGGVDCTAMFYQMTNLVDLSGLANLDTSYVNNMSQMFERCNKIVSLLPLALWDVSNVVNMSGMFKTSFDEYDSWGMFPLRKSIDGLENWDVSNVTDFSDMFSYNLWLNDISALQNWDMSKGTDLSNMLWSADVRSLAGFTFDLSSATDLSVMFAQTMIRHSSQLSKDIVARRYWDEDTQTMVNVWVDGSGNVYDPADVETTPAYITQDATDASTWTVEIVSAGAFIPNTGTGGWVNVPSWN